VIHLWVEGFFEFFVTVIVAVVFYEMGLVKRITALRTIYLDAILYFGGGLIGTGHHWYWTGQTEANMAFSAVFSALEVVPLTLITLDAWDFVRVTRGSADIVERHRWTFFFLMAVGFWNFVGAGVFGFLVNTPIVSYYEVGTILTPNHGHAAMMGVFGMLGAGLIVFVLREVAPENAWPGLQRLVRVAFWGLNIGLAMMVFFSLFPGGVLQVLDVVEIQLDCFFLNLSVGGRNGLGVAPVHPLQVEQFRNVDELTALVEPDHQFLVIKDGSRRVIAACLVVRAATKCADVVGRVPDVADVVR